MKQIQASSLKSKILQDEIDQVLCQFTGKINLVELIQLYLET